MPCLQIVLKQSYWKRTTTRPSCRRNVVLLMWILRIWATIISCKKKETRHKAFRAAVLWIPLELLLWLICITETSLIAKSDQVLFVPIKAFKFLRSHELYTGLKFTTSEFFDLIKVKAYRVNLIHNATKILHHQYQSATKGKPTCMYNVELLEFRPFLLSSIWYSVLIPICNTIGI